MTSKTPGYPKTLDALANWLATTREQVPLLDDAADTLLNQLAWFRHQAAVCDQLAQQPRCLGLYGYCQPGKAELISVLTGGESGHIGVSPAGKPLNYLTHINPAHASTHMAVRFCAQSPATADRKHSDWPLTLRLFSEAELVQLFIQHYQRQPQASRQLNETQLRQRIRQLQPLCQPQPHPAISEAEVAALATQWTLTSRHNLQPALWRQLITLLPQLNLNERAEIYALFWAEQRPLTRQWLQLAQTLQTLGNAREIAAPLSLIVDNFSLPAEGLLNGDISAGHWLVCPLVDNQCLPAVSVDASSLILLTAELSLPLTTSPMLPATDLLDIPGASADNSLLQSKIGFLIDYYRQRQQPDILLVCNAADTISATSHIATRLLRWQQHTQPAHASARPGLIWVITPHDLRFQHNQNPDENIQRLLGKPGETWATLQALESRNLQRMTEWLAAALSASQRKQRHQAITNTLLRDIQHCFAPFTTPAKAADSQQLAQQAIRELQQQAIHHGDLLQALLPDAELLQNLCQGGEAQAATSAQSLFLTDIDLFTDNDTPASEAPAQASDTAHRVWRYWINHVRQWTQQPQHARQLNISADSLRWLGDTLITTSYRLELERDLQTASRQADQAGAQLHAVISNFLCWLGYASVAPQQRPASRINKGAVIFQPAAQQHQRLTRLPDQPSHAATHYVYDWLIALYSHAQQNIGYRHPLDLKSTDRANLKKLLKKVAPPDNHKIQAEENEQQPCE